MRGRHKIGWERKEVGLGKIRGKGIKYDQNSMTKKVMHLNGESGIKRDLKIKSTSL